MVLTINAGEGKEPARAKDLLIAMDSLDGNATFTNIQIGRDATDLNPTAQAGSFGQNSDHVTITNLQQVSRYTTAATFNLVGLRLKVNVGDDAKGKECFAETEPRPRGNGPATTSAGSRGPAHRSTAPARSPGGVRDNRATAHARPGRSGSGVAELPPLAAQPTVLGRPAHRPGRGGDVRLHPDDPQRPELPQRGDRAALAADPESSW